MGKAAQKVYIVCKKHKVEGNRMNEIYITHCSAKKNHHLRITGEKVTPDLLYTATPTQRFMQKCKHLNIEWAIFSDQYGIWFSDEKNSWYEKNPNTVTEQEFDVLVENFNSKLAKYDKIYFYYNPGRFHSLYKRLLSMVNLKERIVFITHLSEISEEA